MKIAKIAALTGMVSVIGTADANMVMAPTSGGGGGGGIALVQSNDNFSCSGSSTCAVTLTGTAAANFISVSIETLDSTSTFRTITSVTTNSTPANCTQVTNARAENNSSGTADVTDIWYCPNIAGGSITVTANASAAPNTVYAVSISEWSGVATTSPEVLVGNNGIIPFNTVSGITLSATGNYTQSNQLSLSTLGHDDTPGTITNSQTTISTDFPAVSYLVTGTTSSAATHSYNWTSNNADISMSLAVFKHP